MSSATSAQVHRHPASPVPIPLPVPCGGERAHPNGRRGGRDARQLRSDARAPSAGARPLLDGRPAGRARHARRPRQLRYRGRLRQAAAPRSTSTCSRPCSLPCASASTPDSARSARRSRSPGSAFCHGGERREAAARVRCRAVLGLSEGARAGTARGAIGSCRSCPRWNGYCSMSRKPSRGRCCSPSCSTGSPVGAS